jgi:hypothetical protein
MLTSLISLLLSCAGPPTAALTWREQWEILILTEDGGLIEGIASSGNTGMIKGEGQFRANRWFDGGTPIFFSMDGGPADIDVAPAHDAIRVGSALLGRFEDGDHWTLRFSNDAANAIVHIDPGGPRPPISTVMNTGGQWTLASAITHGRSHGWFTAGRRGGMFEGRAVALHRGGDGRPDLPRQTVVIMGPDVSIGIDQQGQQQLIWARIGDHDVPAADMRLNIADSGPITIDFRPGADLEITLEPSGLGGSVDTATGLLPPERWIAHVANLGLNRHVSRAKTTFSYSGKTHSVSAAIVQVN